MESTVTLPVCAIIQVCPMPVRKRGGEMIPTYTAATNTANTYLGLEQLLVVG